VAEAEDLYAEGPDDDEDDEDNDDHQFGSGALLIGKTLLRLAHQVVQRRADT
jgi:hypothetical protein